MRIKKYLGLAICFLCLRAYTADKPDLRALAEAAIRNNPDSLRATEELRAAELDAAAERADRLLSGHFSANAKTTQNVDSPHEPVATYSGQVSADTTMPAGSKLGIGAEYGISHAASSLSDSANVSLDWSIPILVNGRLVDARLDAAAKASVIDVPLETARATAAANSRAVMDSAIRIALDAASADRSYGLAIRRADLNEREAVIARVKCGIGELSFSELGKAEKAADEARLTALEARFEREKKIRKLCAATGLGEESLDLTLLRAPDKDVGEEKLSCADTSPDVAQAIRDRRVAEMSRILVGATHAPQFKISASGALLGPESRKDESASDGSWSATASLSIPLSAGVGSARRKAADARLSSAYQHEVAVRQSAEESLASAWNAYSAALARVRLREELLGQSRARLREARSALDSNTATQLDVDGTELTVDETAAALEDDRSACFKAALDMYALCGLDPRELLSNSATTN